MTDQGPQDFEGDFDAGWLIEGLHGEAYDLAKLPFIVQDRIDRYPDQEEMTRWKTEHRGVNYRPVEEAQGSFSLYLTDTHTGVEFVFGEFDLADLKS
jgi:hypothetical protein